MSLKNIVQDNINDKLIELSVKNGISIQNVMDAYEHRLRFMTKYNSYKGHESKAMFLSYKLVKDNIERKYVSHDSRFEVRES
jgi:hypothetical protein